MRRALRRLARRLLRWGGWALDALYPRDCFFCGRPSGDSQICLECYERLTLTRHPACLVCGAESALPEGPDFVCSDCFRRRPAFTRAFIAARYDGDVRALIHAFKYHGGLWLTDDLVRILIAHYLARIAPLRLGIDAVVPVPMLRRKRLRRVHTGVLSQTRLARAERLANAKRAYRARRRAPIRGRTILLVDDVLTTGATCDACAHALLSAGAKRVYVLALARPLFL
ncbi:MAG TPA: ComF family protein [Candidatus Spyradenecus faecavium]|uniref:ComF family protein n=1 Tax=Candidatus Spyradenecus faecavium TaxID=2840947 RepID=A0A9D1T2T3_9BACT|nr:ComF family protein [Candidatus Spyradenecus faecavium]